jgi:hypothetical protein
MKKHNSKSIRHNFSFSGLYYFERFKFGQGFSCKIRISIQNSLYKIFPFQDCITLKDLNLGKGSHVKSDTT